jgi:xanthine/uracil permease
MIPLRSVGGWIVVLFSSLVWAGGEGVTDADQSDDSAQLFHLASIYLDLGYGGYVNPEKKLAFFQKGARLP